MSFSTKPADFVEYLAKFHRKPRGRNKGAVTQNPSQVRGIFLKIKNAQKPRSDAVFRHIR